jgi:hypothetical protein
MPGWLGANAPEDFIRGINNETPLPCHSTINYERKDWQEKWTARKLGKMCAGAIILAANISKRPRPGLIPTGKVDKVLVFANAKEFVDHHRSRGRGSWEMDLPAATEPASKLEATPRCHFCRKAVDAARPTSATAATRTRASWARTPSTTTKIPRAEP